MQLNEGDLYRIERQSPQLNDIFFLFLILLIIGRCTLIFQIFSFKPIANYYRQKLYFLMCICFDDSTNSIEKLLLSLRLQFSNFYLINNFALNFKHNSLCIIFSLYFVCFPFITLINNLDMNNMLTAMVV